VDDRGRRSWYPGQDRAEVFDHESDPMEMNDCAGRDWRKSSWLSELQAAHAGAMAPTIGRVSPW